MSLTISDEVAHALAAGRPVVALESTLVSHGLPRPQNLEVAHAMAQAVRGAGAVPAMVAVLDGAIRIGLTDAEVERLADAPDAIKCSTRDLAWATATGATGATTVAATIFVAARAGIRVMATGGLGGVHRGFGDGHDVSADLGELGRTGVAVVCSGAKIILDVPRTLETLETMGVPVLGYRTGDLPGFYTERTGLAVPAVPDIATLARIVATHAELGWPSAVVIAQPPPADLAMPSAEVEALIESALADAAIEGVRGKAVTPYLLARMARDSAGRTVELNCRLIESNARLAGALSKQLSELINPVA